MQQLICWQRQNPFFIKPVTAALSAVPRRPCVPARPPAPTADMGYSSARSLLTCVRSLPALARLRVRRLCSTLYPGFAWRRRILQPLALASITYVMSIIMSGFYLVIPFTLLPQFNAHARTPLTAIPSLLFFLFVITNMVLTFILTIVTEPGRVPATWKCRGFQMEYPSKPDIPVPVPSAADEVGPASTPADNYPDPRSRQHVHASTDAAPSPSTMEATPPYSATASASTTSGTNDSSAVSIRFQTPSASSPDLEATAAPTSLPQDQWTRRRAGTGEIDATGAETNTGRTTSRNLHSSAAITISSASNNDSVARADDSRRDTYQALDDEGQPETPQEYPIVPNELWAAGTMVRHNGRFRYCFICERFKPDRTHHCGSCGACVLHMDHHCPFVGNACVGLHNRKFFLLFLYYTTWSAWSVTLISWRAVFQYMFIEYPTSDNHPWLQSIEQTYRNTAPVILRFLVGMSYIMIAVHALALTPFTAYHFRLVLLNRTSLDDMDKSNEYHNELLVSSDRDFKTHWRMVFGKTPWAWFLPISYDRDTEMDGLRWLPAYLPSGRSDHIHARAHGTKDELESIHVQPASSDIDRGDGLH